MCQLAYLTIQIISIPLWSSCSQTCIIEKHFTLNKKAPGPDHQSSIEPAELKELVKVCQLYK